MQRAAVALQHDEISFPPLGIEPSPLHWKVDFFTTRYQEVLEDNS